MKKLLLTAFVIGASYCTGIAQDMAAATPVSEAKKLDEKTDQAKRMKEWKAILVTELKLTDEQQKKIAELDASVSERAKAIASNTSLAAEEKKEKSIGLRKARNTQFNALLTAEQQARYKEIIEANKSHR